MKHRRAAGFFTMKPSKRKPRKEQQLLKAIAICAVTWFGIPYLAVAAVALGPSADGAILATMAIAFQAAYIARYAVIAAACIWLAYSWGKNN